jgi:beta-lactamase class A
MILLGMVRLCKRCVPRGPIRLAARERWRTGALRYTANAPAEPPVSRVRIAPFAALLLLPACDARRTTTIVTHDAAAYPEVAAPAPDPLIDGPADAALQLSLERLEARVAGELAIPDAERAFGVLDLGASDATNTPRLAMIHGDRLFYAASVPKIAIVAAYFAKFPDAAETLAPNVARELERVLKLSDNDLAAKYSQLVGLEYIQAWLEQPGNRLYERAGRGGLWCGKHYGVERPRLGDPLADHSHAATARALLRFYWLLENDRLVSPAASRRIRRLFAAPELDFHNDNFVRGLNGRDVTLIRKNGLWEDWHLDTARVQHGGHAYILVGLTHHAQGQEYLSRMAAAVDELLCGNDDRPQPHWHDLYAFDKPANLTCHADGAPATFTAEPLAARGFFNEVVLSWNLGARGDCGACVELRVGRSWDDFWSPWLHVGELGNTRCPEPRVTAFDGGRIDVDYFRSGERFDRLQWRVRAGRVTPSSAPATGDDGVCRIECITACVSDTSGIPLAASRPAGRSLLEHVSPRPPVEWQRRLPVPFRSQKAEPPELAGRICSPTSVAMVLEYRGVRRPTREVVATCLDASHGIYGNWPANVQAAYSLGVPGYLTRFSTWNDVEQCIAAGQPLIISIRVDRPGELPGAPYNTSDGHLLVLCGFDRQGNVEVNDPAAATAAAGQITYPRAALERCWLRRTGLAYVLLPPE